jgi:hypothetical protein
MNPIHDMPSIPNSILAALARACTPLLMPLVLVAVLSSAHSGLAQVKPPRDVSQFNLGRDGLALQGYDPVAYFAEGGAKPTKGLDTITVKQDGVLYRFATEEHKKLFLASPDKYEPAYGGWCAYAMSKKEKVEVDPESFLTTNGRLMLFYKGFFNDTRSKWLKDEAGFTTKADAGWKQVNVPPKPKEK